MLVWLGRRMVGTEVSCANSQLKRTSLAVNGVPSCHFTLRRRCQVTCIVPSGLTTHVPSDSDGSCWASIGTGWASWLSMLSAEWPTPQPSGALMALIPWMSTRPWKMVLPVAMLTVFGPDRAGMPVAGALPPTGAATGDPGPEDGAHP